MGFEISDEGRLRFACCGCCRSGTARIRWRIGPGGDACVVGKPFANLVEPFVFRRAGKQAATFAPEGQRIGDRLGPAASARLDRPAERPPFKLYPEAPLECIEMLVRAVALRALH